MREEDLFHDWNRAAAIGPLAAAEVMD